MGKHYNTLSRDYATPPVERMFWRPSIVALMLSSGSLFSNPTFLGIDGTTDIRTISAKGNIAGAENNLAALHWDSNAGLTDIGHLIIPGYGPNHTTEVAGISADGSVLVGSSSSYSSSWSKTQAYRWTQQGGFTPLVNLSVLESHAVGISDDGRTVAGWIIVETGQHAVLWRDGQEFLRLDAGTSFGGIARNGVWVTGVKAEGNNVQPFRWSADTGLIFLGEGAEGSYGRAISDDGNVVVGQGDAHLPFRWSTTEGMESLGVLTGGDQGYATALSADGKTVVGVLFNTGAFIWTEANGLRDLKEFLQTDLGMDLSGWKLNSAWAIAGDGLMIAGRGIKLKPYTQSGDAQGFIARLADLPTPHIAIENNEGAIWIEFRGVLQTSPDLMQWTDLEPQPSNPYLLAPSNGQFFFRARTP